jgi:hypothetical protein
LGRARSVFEVFIYPPESPGSDARVVFTMLDEDGQVEPAVEMGKFAHGSHFYDDDSLSSVKDADLLSVRPCSRIECGMSGCLSTRLTPEVPPLLTCLTATGFSLFCCSQLQPVLSAKGAEYPLQKPRVDRIRHVCE